MKPMKGITSVVLATSCSVLLAGRVKDARAAVPGCEVNEFARLAASDPIPGDQFGISVSVSGNIAVTGTINNLEWYAHAGAAYVFRFDGESWTEEQKLVPSDAPNCSSFGLSVSASGNVIIVGDHMGRHEVQSGTAYIFRYNGYTWAEEQKLVASDAAAGDSFGISVSISGDTAIVGAQGDSDAGNMSGSAYVFRYDGGTWIQEQKLTASDGAAVDWFGCSVLVSGDIAVVGASEDDDAGDYSGSVYVFRHDGSGWVEEQKLTASDGAAFDRLGVDVSIADDVIVAGAPGKSQAGYLAGAAYVFGYDGGGWVEEQRLTAPDASPIDFFGGAVSIGGNVIVVGAAGDDDEREDSGSAYVFRLLGDRWVAEQKLRPSYAAIFHDFGRSVSMAGDWTIIGAPNMYPSAYLFDALSDGIPDECGACCGTGPCIQVTQAECESLDGWYAGDGTTCEEEDCGNIPAVTAWSLVAMGLLTVTAGTLVLVRRRMAV